MAPKALLERADQSAKSARLLLEHGDTGGATSRAYYAMFDAARAALVATGHELTKTHRGLISAFSLHLVKGGLISIEYSRDLNQAEQLRLIADYIGDPIERATASDIIARADRFVAHIRERLVPEPEPQKARAPEEPARRRDRGPER